MQYRILGKTGLSVSAIGIESHQWSGRGGIYFSREDVAAILSRAYDLGINFIDTGECYLYHGSERLIGEALGTLRGNFVIATKFGHTIREGQVAEGWEGRIVENMLFDENARILSRALVALPLSAVQTVYNRLDREAEKKIIPLAIRENLGVIARLPLAKGYLSSRFKTPEEYGNRKRLATAAKVKAREVPEGADLAEWAIGWCLRREEVATVVPGCGALAHLTSSVRALKHII